MTKSMYSDCFFFVFFEKLVTYKEMSLTRGCCNRRFDCFYKKAKQFLLNNCLVVFNCSKKKHNVWYRLYQKHITLLKVICFWFNLKVYFPAKGELGFTRPFPKIYCRCHLFVLSPLNAENIGGYPSWALSPKSLTIDN